ncbi:MAG: DUF309 domain-containing protein [Thermoplasmataceae archaeon]
MIQKGHRILLLIARLSIPDLERIEGYLTRKIIVRRHTDSLEIDLETMEPSKVVSFFRSSSALLLIRKLMPEETVTKLGSSGLVIIREQILDTASALFEEERYWESHILLESLWKATTGEYKKYIQNLIYFAVSMIKYQMGEYQTAMTIFQKAMENFKQKYSLPIDNLIIADFRYPYSLDFTRTSNIPKI